MDDKNLNTLASLIDSVSESEKSKTQSGYSGINSQPSNSEHKEDIRSGENAEHKGDADIEHSCCLGANVTKGFVDNHSLMETEDAVSPPVSISTSCKHENKEKYSDVGPQPSDILDEDNKMENEKLCQTENSSQPKGVHCLTEANLDKDLEDGQCTLQVNFELTETVMVSEEQKCSNSGAIAENGCQPLRDGSPSKSNNRSCIL